MKAVSSTFAMPLPKFSFRIAFALAAVVLGLAAIPSHGADKDEPREPVVTKPKRPALPRGFGGVTSEEAQKAGKLFAQGQALQERGKLRAALKRYRALTKKFPRSAAAPKAFYESARIHLQRNKPQRAFEAFDVIIRAYPDFGRFNELVSEEYRIAYEVVKGKRIRVFGFIPGRVSREKGIEYFERLVMNAPYSDYAPLALMNIATECMRRKETEYAVDALDRLITNYPNSLVTSDGYLRMAEVHERSVNGALYDQEATRQSISFYEDFLILFPKDSKVGQAEGGLARMKDMLARSRLKMAEFYYLKRARYQAARVFYNEAITIAPTSESARIARERIAQLEVDEAKAEARKAKQAQKKPGTLSRWFGGSRQPPPPPAPTPAAAPAAAPGPASKP